MEPPHFGLSRYALRWWRSVFPDSARKSLLKQSAFTSPFHKQLLATIHDRLPEGPYQSLKIEQQLLVDAGIYIAANRLQQAIVVFQELMEKQDSDKEWICSLMTEIDSLPLNGHQIENYPV